MEISAVEDTYFPQFSSIRLKDNLLDLKIPRVMGIINITPDSFYSISQCTEITAVLKRVANMIEDGADIIDLGGFSTRPGTTCISEIEEINRVIPIIDALKKEFSNIIISLDTFRGKVAESGIEHGADLINDISGFQFDDAMLDTLEKYKLPYILMHCNSTFETMHQTKNNELLFNQMIRYFSEKLSQLKDRGVYDVIIDPGIGFGKTMSQNFELINQLPLLNILEKPILVGFSRKSIIYKTLGIPPEEALNGTTVLNTLALMKGASILRVHDVKEAKQIIQLVYN